MESDTAIRLGVFLSVLILMVLWESLAPRRERVANRWRRSFCNLLLLAIGSLLIRLIPAFSAVAAAQWAAANEFGMLHQIGGPAWLEGLVAFFALDVLIYGQHVALHRFPILWRFHAVHHADLDLDATSGVRFHPGELLLSMGMKIIAVTLLGAAPVMVVIFEIVLNATSMFNHGNVLLPVWSDRCLRWILVTPDMHRVHHSILPEETHSNFGFNLPWWDWLFRTYRAQPRDPHERLTLGLPALRTELQTVPLAAMLVMPFRSSRDQKPDPNEGPGTQPA